MDIPHVLIVGDSITKGQYVEPAMTWPVLINQRLQRSKVDLYVYTSAVSGETTSHGIQRLITELHSFVPTAIFIQFGLNDANYWITEGGRIPRTSLTRFRENLREMIFRARDAGVEDVTLFTNHKVYKDKAFETCTYGDSKAKYDEAIRDVAESMGVDLLDLARMTEVLFTEAHLLPSPDLLHLSPLGHEIYATLVWDYVNTVFIPTLRDSPIRVSRAAQFVYNSDWT